MLVPHPVARTREPNFAVENVNAPRRVYDEKARVQATVAGFGTEQATRRVTLSLNGREVDTKSVEVPADGRATVEFLALEAAATASTRAKCGSIPATACRTTTASTSRWSAPTRAACCSCTKAATSATLLYFRTALEAAAKSAFALDAADRRADRATSTSRKYAFVVLSDVGLAAGNFENSLRDYVRGGGSC